MSVRPGTPIGERVRKRRRGDAGEVLEDATELNAKSQHCGPNAEDTNRLKPSALPGDANVADAPSETDSVAAEHLSSPTILGDSASPRKSSLTPSPQIAGSATASSVSISPALLPPLTPGPTTPSSLADSPALLTPLTPLTPYTPTTIKTAGTSPEEHSDNPKKILHGFGPTDLHSVILTAMKTSSPSITAALPPANEPATAAHEKHTAPCESAPAPPVIEPSSTLERSTQPTPTLPVTPNTHTHPAAATVGGDGTNGVMTHESSAIVVAPQPVHAAAPTQSIGQVTAPTRLDQGLSAPPANGPPPFPAATPGLLESNLPQNIPAAPTVDFAVPVLPFGTTPALNPPQPIVPLVPAVPQVLAGMEDVPAAVLATVMQISTTSLPDEHIYGIGALPSRLDWGRGRQERKLCDGRNTTYVRYGGRVRTTWFFDRSGTPQSRVNVGVNLILDTDEQAMEKLFQKRAPPIHVPEVVFASRLQGQRERGSFTEKVVPFRNVFDARDGVLAKTEQRRINAVDFTDNDIIVVEAEMTRWKPGRGPGWTEFDVGFELAAIYLLWASP